MENVSSSNGLEKCPKLRFPGFTEPWAHVKLSSFAERVTRKNRNNETNLPLTISSKDGLVDQISFFNKTVASKDMSGYYLLKNGEYAYNKSYSVGYDFGSIKRLERYPMGALSTLYICFALKKYNSDYIKTYFDSLKWYKEIYMISAEGARNHGLLNVPTDDFFDTYHYITEDTDEQFKIAKVIELLEQKIQKQQELVEYLKKYKRGLFEAVFTQKIRLVENTKAWEKIQLSEFANRITRKNGQQTDIPLTISAQYGLIDQREFFSKTVASADMSSYYLLEMGEFAYNRSTSNEYPFGSIKRLEKYPIGAVSTLYLCFSIDTDIVNSDFIKLFFESAQWHRQIREICAEGARNHGLLNVPTDGFFDCCFTLPRDMEEQEAIAKFLTNIQSKLDSELLKLEFLTTIKKGLLQQLFI